jgi:Tol biopolymer transport system component/serine/threonine protein kinase
VKEVFEAAVERDSSQRAAFLDEACDGDMTLRREAESLIESYEKEKGFMSLPVIAAAAPSLFDKQAESLMGQMAGHYKILTHIGAGGMGEVYLAQDTRLGRQVALKLLPTYLKGDSDRLRRFEQEARAASSLNHPNVCMIHEVGEMEDGRHYIVMEHIEGVTLRQQMATHPLKLGQALDIATQVAAALAAAHGAGIVHRDIKPENVMVRNDGLIKVLDFGLAKRTTVPVVVDDGASTKVLVHTEPGMVMGTVAYMSPEQARGLEIDARTDIWSLGVVLYEMVTTKVPFAGATSSDLIVSILDRHPLPLSRHLPDLPPELQRIVSKALRKDKEDRYQVVKDLFLDLKSLKQELEFEARLQHSAQPESSGEIGSREVTGEAAHNLGQQTKEVQTARTTLSAEFPKGKPLLWTVGVVVGLMLLAAGAWYFSRSITKPGPTQPALTAVPLTTDPGFEGMPSLSPDGNQVAYASGGPQTDNFDIYVKQIGGGPPRRLTSDAAVDVFPAWSPDGRSIAFIRERGDKMEVLLIPSLGGPERKIADTVADNSTFIFSWAPPYLSWSADSKYLVTTDRASPGEPHSLFVLSVATGEKRRLTTPPATALADGNPAISPDGRTLAFVRIASHGNPQLYVLPLSADYKSAGEERHLDLSQPSVFSPAWTADGQEILCSVGQRWGEWRLWRVPLSGSEKPQLLPSVGTDDSQPTISRQGDHFVYAHWTADLDIWRADVSSRGEFSPPMKLIASTRWDGAPQYSPDGSKIAFFSDRSGHYEVWVCNADGSNPVQLTLLESSSGYPGWFPDGKRIVFDSSKEGNTDVYTTDITTLVPHRLTTEPGDDLTPSVSHDSEWIYFASRRTGRLEVWRMRAEGGEAVQVTHKGGWSPKESPDGKVVYYLLPDSLDVWKVAIGGGEETRVLGPVAEFAVTAEGIYFIEIGTRLWVGTAGNSLKFFSFDKGTTEKVADVKLNPLNGLSVSPDGRYVLFSQIDPFVSDLMLVENFR